MYSYVVDVCIILGLLVMLYVLILVVCMVFPVALVITIVFVFIYVCDRGISGITTYVVGACACGYCTVRVCCLARVCGLFVCC